MEQEYILSVQARNHAGVLLRISGLFSRRGYNIKSLIAAQTEDPEYSEIIIVVQGNETVVRLVPVSYTHLDVYKRQFLSSSRQLRLPVYLLFSAIIPHFCKKSHTDFAI